MLIFRRRAGTVAAASLALVAVAGCGRPGLVRPVAIRSSMAREVNVVDVANWRSGKLDRAVCSQLGDGGLNLLLLGPSQLQVEVAVRAGKLSAIVARDDRSGTAVLVRDTVDGTLTVTDQAVTLEGLEIGDGHHVMKLNGSVGCS